MDWQIVVTGVLFGLASGLTPGPLTTLVMTETLRHGFKNGLQVAVSPALTDAPIVIAAILLLARIGKQEPILGSIYLAGACVLFWLGWSTLRSDPCDPAATAARPRSLWKGVVANVVNPHPYLFWATVGGPILLRAAGVGWATAVGFLGAHYGLMIGSKVVLAFIVGRGRAVLSSRVYRVVLRTLGLVLLGYGALFLREAIGRFG